MNTTENLISTGCTAIRKQNRQTYQISTTTTGVENRIISGKTETGRHAAVRYTGPGSRLLCEAPSIEFVTG